MKRKKFYYFLTLLIILLSTLNSLLFLYQDITSGYLNQSNELKTFIFTLISFGLGVTALIGIWKMKKWAFVPLAGIFIFGLVLSVLYPPTYISGNLQNKLNNLPLDVYIGFISLIMYSMLYHASKKLISNPHTHGDGQP